MTATEYSQFISSLQVSCDTQNCAVSQPDQSTDATTTRKRKKRPRDDFPPQQERVSHAESSSTASDSNRPYRTRQRRVRHETEDYYDESEVDILLHEQS